MARNGKPREYTLPNGLVVALQSTPTETTAVELRVNYGPSHQQSGEEGIAHFLEHCLVRAGSAKYDPATAQEIWASFSYTNAYTNQGRIWFDGNMLHEDLEAWLKYVADHALNPRLDSERIEQERNRVLREIADDKSRSENIAMMKLLKEVYGDHPKGVYVLGSEEVVKTADVSKLRNFHSRGFHPNNMDLFIAGKMPDNIEEIIEQNFGGAERGENTRRTFPKKIWMPKPRIVHSYAPERKNVEFLDESSASIILLSEAPSTEEKDSFTFSAMNKVLGGGSNSRLFQHMSQRRGLAYSASTAVDDSYGTGELMVQATVPAKRIGEAVDIIFEEFERMKRDPATLDDVEQIKKNSRYAVASTLESNMGHIIVMKTKSDHGLTPEDVMAGYSEVTPQSMVDVANKYLPDRNGSYFLDIRDPLLESPSD